MRDESQHDQIEKVATSSCHIDDHQGFRAIDVTLNVFGEVTLPESAAALAGRRSCFLLQFWL